MFGSIFFIGHVFGSYFLAEYGDTVGRILLIKIGQGTTLVSYALIIYVTRSVPVIYCLIFTFGMLSCWRLSLAYIYASEIVAESTQNFAGSLFNLFDSQVMMSSSLFILYISKDWIKLHTVFLIMTIFSFLVFCVIPESPKYLVQMKDYQQAMKSYNLIGWFNNSSNRLQRDKDRFY